MADDLSRRKNPKVEQKGTMVCFAGSEKPLPMFIRSRCDATEIIQIRCNIKRDLQKRSEQ